MVLSVARAREGSLCCTNSAVVERTRDRVSDQNATRRNEMIPRLSPILGLLSGSCESITTCAIERVGRELPKATFVATSHVVTMFQPQAHFFERTQWDDAAECLTIS